MNKIKSLVLAAIGLLCCMSVSAEDFEVDGIYYNITSNADLTVAVTFKGSYSNSYSNEYSGTVTIPESVAYSGKTYSVTNVGNYAFYKCDGLTSITIPNSVTSIGDYAFGDCNGLISITIPNSVTSIGDYVFGDCNGLISITIPNSVTSIGDDAFNRCTGLTSITIGDSVTSIGDNAFYRCSGLTSVTIPNSVTSIGNDAFSYCKGLTSITIPNRVTSIGYRAFYSCSGLTSIVVDAENPIYDSRENCNAIIESKSNSLIAGCMNTIIPNSVTSIGGGAFYYCSGLTSITIPNSVTSIGSLAFYNCSGLTSITIPNSVTSIVDDAFSYCSGLTSITIPNSVTSIGYRAFQNCSNLTSITIPNSVTSIGDDAFYSCSGLTSIVVDAENPIYDSRESCNAIIESKSNSLIAGCMNTIIPNSVTSIGYRAFSGCSGLTSITIPNSVKSLGSSALADCSGLTSITIGDSVTSIGDRAFSGCSGLTSIIIPNSVTSIGEQAFFACYDLTSITIPNSVTSIGSSAFWGTAWYDNLPDGVVYIGNVLYNYKGTMPKNTSIEVKEGTVSISPKAFSSCSDLIFISIPGSVTSIGEYAFYGTAWYDKQPDGVVYAGNVLYKYKGSMPSRTSIEVKGGTVSISPEAFRGCSGLISVTIPNSVTSIGDKAFADCISLTSITIPNSVTSIGDEAFYCCDRLTSITLPNSLTSIGDWTFYGSGLTSITIPNSVTSIGDYAFNSCYYLTSVTIPNSVIHIGDGAFYRCSRLSSITIPSSVTSIKGYTFYECSSLTSVEIPNSVTSISDYAFGYCENLKQLISYAEVPPICDSYVFYGVNTPECTLYVPYGAKTVYSEAEYWKNFTNIEELEPSIYELTDGEEYNEASDMTVEAVTYTRTLPNLYWNALYVPFELPYDVIAEHYDVAYINDVNGYDTDDNGTIDDLAMEIIKIKGGTLKANYPYLIKAKTEADKAMSITVEDATLYAAEENSVRCSSVYQNYAVTGIYTKKTAEELAGKLAISTSGAWQPLAAGTALNPFRLYLSIENLDDSPLKVETSAMSRMRIVEYGETTGVETITPAQQREDVIFDLSGCRVKQPVKGGVYIVNGKKRIF